jgi:hypothetical protein
VRACALLLSASGYPRRQCRRSAALSSPQTSLHEETRRSIELCEPLEVIVFRGWFTERMSRSLTLNAALTIARASRQQIRPATRAAHGFTRAQALLSFPIVGAGFASQARHPCSGTKQPRWVKQAFLPGLSFTPCLCRTRNIRSTAALNAVMSPQKLPGGREGRARAYVVIADRLQFHLEAGTLPAEAAGHVRHAHDALMKASAALRRAEIEKVSMPENPAKPNLTGL